MSALICFAALAAALAPGAAQAKPDQEKIALTGPGSSSGAIVAHLFSPFAWILVANRTTRTLTIFDLQTMSTVKNASGTTLSLTVVNDPVAIATYVDNVNNPTFARAFVAGFSSHRISVIDLLATPPAVVTGEEIDLTDESDTSTPGPVSLLVNGTNLFVANGTEGTIQMYNVSAPVAVSLNFGTGANDQTTPRGNLVVCNVGDGTPSSGKLRVLLSYSSRLWAGCENGVVSAFDTSGDVALRGDLNQGGGGIDNVRALAGDPRAGTNILYVLDDEQDGVFAVDVASGVFENTGSDPTIDPVCTAGGSDSELIPVDDSAESTAMVAFNDPSASGGGDFLAVLNTVSSASNLQLIDLASIDKSGATSPDCTLTTGTIHTVVDLDLGNAAFPANATPAGIAQKIVHHLGYIAIPNFSVTDGAGALTLVTDNPSLTGGSVVPSALAAANNPLGLAELSSQLTWDADETIQSSPTPTVGVRIKGEPLTFTALTATVTTGDDLGVTVTTTNLLGSGVVGASADERLEIIALGADASGDKGFGAKEIVFDSTDPLDPMGASVVEGDSLLVVTVSFGSPEPANEDIDPDPGNGVRSGIRGYYIDFTSAVDDLMNPVALPADVEAPSGSRVFTVGGLTNEITYTFDIYAVDRAGNHSAMPFTASGRPVPGLGIIELTGEDGCNFIPAARDRWLGFALAWLLAFAVAGWARRRA